MGDGRDVTLKIKVDDKDVDKGVASLNRLKAAANDVGTPNVFGGKKPVENEEQQRRLAAFLGKDLPNASNAAKTAVEEVEKASAETSGSLANLTSSGLSVSGVFESLVASGGPVTLVIAGIILVVVGLVGAMVKLSTEFAAYATEIDKSVRITGLQTETLAALKLVADETGTSFGIVESAAEKFRKTVGLAAAGNAQAAASLKLLGVGTDAIYHIDDAFRTALTTILKMPDGVEKTRAVMALFDGDVAKTQEFLRGFNGNIDDAVNKVRQFGTVVDGPGMKANREYTKATADLSAAWEGFKTTLGASFISTLTAAIEKMSELIQKAREIDLPGIVGRAAMLAGTGGGIGTGTYEPSAGGTGSPSSAPMNSPNNQADIAAQQAAVQEAIASAEHDADNALTIARNAASALKEKASKFYSTLLENFKNTPQTEDYLNQFKSLLSAGVKGYTQALDQILKTMDQIETSKANLKPHPASDDQARTSSQFARRTSEMQAILDLEDRGDEEIRQRRQQNAKKEAEDAKRAEEQTLAERIAGIQRDIQAQAAGYEGSRELKNREYATGLITEKEYIDQLNEYDRNELENKKKFLNDEIKAIEDARARQPELADKLKKDIADRQGQIKTLDQQLANKTVNPQRTTEDTLRAQIQALRDQQSANPGSTAAAINAERLKVASMTVERDTLIGIAQIQDHLQILRTSDATLIAERRRLAVLNEEYSLTQELTAINDKLADGGVNDSLAIEVAHARDLLDLRNRELDAVIRTNRAQLELAHSMEISNNQIRAGVYEHMASVSSLNKGIIDGINGTFDAISGQLDKQLDKLNNWSHGMLSFITEPLKAMAHKQLSDIFSSVLDSIFPGAGLGKLLTQTNNPVAKPIVDKLDTTNSLLSQLVSASGQVPAAGGMSGILGGLLGSLGGSGGGGIFSGGGSGYILNAAPGGGGGAANDLMKTLMSEGSSAPGAPGSPSNRGILGNLSNIFKPGGIFGKDGFGNNAGTYAGIGALANLAGGIIGGRAGTYLSNIGSGLSTGAMIGTMILPGIGTAVGAAIGAAVGFFATLFGGDPKKKTDKNDNMPKLEQGFSDATSQLRQILQDIRTLNTDPDAALSKARDIRSQIANGIGIQFGSKQYQKQSQMEIAEQLAALDHEPDGLMAQIIAAAAIARGAADRSKRILPEFAGGHYFADYFRPNGLIPGVFDSRDDMLAMLTRGEMVLNPTQQNNVRRAAGHDVFANAGIPNYPRSNPSPRLASGGVAGGGRVAFQAEAPTINIQPFIEIHGVPIDQHIEAYITSDSGVRTQIAVNKKLKDRGDI